MNLQVIVLVSYQNVAKLEVAKRSALQKRNETGGSYGADFDLLVHRDVRVDDDAHRRWSMPAPHRNVIILQSKEIEITAENESLGWRRDWKGIRRRQRRVFSYLGWIAQLEFAQMDMFFFLGDSIPCIDMAWVQVGRLRR